MSAEHVYHEMLTLQCALRSRWKGNGKQVPESKHLCVARQVPPLPPYSLTPLLQLSSQSKCEATVGEDDGIVTASLLAAELQWLTLTMQKTICFGFRHALNAACRSMTNIVNVLKGTLVNNPTMAMHALLKQPAIFARAGGNIVEVFPCQQLKPTAYKFMPMTHSCTRGIPIKFSHNGNPNSTGYLDPITNIIRQGAMPAECSLSDTIPLFIGNCTLLYHRKSAELEEVKNMPSLGLYHWWDAPELLLKPI